MRSIGQKSPRRHIKEMNCGPWSERRCRGLKVSFSATSGQTQQDNRSTLPSASQRPDQSSGRWLTWVTQVRAEQDDKLQLHH